MYASSKAWQQFGTIPPTAVKVVGMKRRESFNTKLLQKPRGLTAHFTTLLPDSTFLAGGERTSLTIRMKFIRMPFS